VDALDVPARRRVAIERVILVQDGEAGGRLCEALARRYRVDRRERLDRDEVLKRIGELRAGSALRARVTGRLELLKSGREVRIIGEVCSQIIELVVVGAAHGEVRSVSLKSVSGGGPLGPPFFQFAESSGRAPRPKKHAR
jgi:hypothetical protein